MSFPDQTRCICEFSQASKGFGLFAFSFAPIRFDKLLVHSNLGRLRGKQTTGMDKGQGTREGTRAQGEKFDCAPWVHKAKEMPREEFKGEVDRFLTGRERAVGTSLLQGYKSQLGVIERALETAGLMLGSDKSRGYCLEMICADLLAGVNIEESNPEALVFSLRRIYELLPREQQTRFLNEICEHAMSRLRPRQPRIQLDPEAYKALCREVLNRDGWRCQNCGASENLQVHHIQSRSELGNDRLENLITLCADCHGKCHRSSR